MQCQARPGDQREVGLDPEPLDELSRVAAQQQPLDGIVEQKVVGERDRVGAAGRDRLDEHAAAKKLSDRGRPVRVEAGARDLEAQRLDRVLAHAAENLFARECLVGGDENALAPVDVEQLQLGRDLVELGPVDAEVEQLGEPREVEWVADQLDQRLRSSGEELGKQWGLIAQLLDLAVVERRHRQVPDSGELAVRQLRGRLPAEPLQSGR